MLLWAFGPWKKFLGVCLNVHAMYARETGVNGAYVHVQHIDHAPTWVKGHAVSTCFKVKGQDTVL